MSSDRIALISDIHGNLAGLNAVLRDAQEQCCTRIVCLGDLVEGGEHNEAVVRLIRDRGITCVQGNHDENNALVLADDVTKFLSRLPGSLTEGDVHYTHISPRRRQRKIDSEVEAWNVFDECLHRIIFIGHVHVPLIFGARSSMATSATHHQVESAKPFRLAADDRYVICVGAVGYGRDGIRKPRYGIWDVDAATIEIRAMDAPVLAIG